MHFFKFFKGHRSPSHIFLVVIDPDELYVPYHRNMIASLKHCKGGMDAVLAKPMKFLVLGLGGGLLTKFLYEKFPKVGL